MVLSDNEISYEIQKNMLVTSIRKEWQLEQIQLQPASYDIRLDGDFMVMNHVGVLRMGEKPEYTKIKSSRYLLEPKKFILASTLEYFRLPDNITAFVEGRSSIGRIGLFIQNAGWVDPGFEGTITLELFNASDSPILLEEGRRIGQMVFVKCEPVANLYKGKYQGQIGATGSMLQKDPKRSAK